MLDQLAQLLVENFEKLGYFTRILLVINLLLLVFSRPLMMLLDRGGDKKAETNGSRLHFFRITNLLILIFILFYQFFIPHLDSSLVSRMLGGLIVIYLAWLSVHLLNWFVKRRFGRKRDLQGEVIISETYRSRLISLLVKVLVFVIALIAIVRILGFTSLLEAGGVIGFIGVLLALTQGAWAPDIISGLVILNSQLVEEGDVIEVDDGTERIVGSVYKTKVFHTELLDLVNNHRIMVQNARLRGMTIHNLSKFASAKGLREALRFKIGYEVTEQQVREMVEEAFLKLQESGNQEIEFQHEKQVRVTAAGDYAIEWTLYYYTKQLRQLLQTRQTVLLAVTNASRKAGISLATPLIVDSKNHVSD